MLTGRCHCGHCRYQIDLDALDDVAHCHCSVCRRTTGAPLVTWATIPAATLHWLGAEPARYASSAQARRHFCSQCGAQLAIENDAYPGTIDITVATLDEPRRFPPDRHIWAADRLPWLQLDEQLPRYDDEHWSPAH